MRLVWRVFGANAAIISLAALILALSPATIDSSIALTQALVLAIGTVVLLLIDLLLVRQAFQSFDRMVRFMSTVDPLRPGARAEVPEADRDVREVATAFNEMLDRLEHERRDSARRQLLAQEAERRRIAQDLHDEVGQLLTAALLRIDQARDVPDDASPLVEARRATETALEEVRAISRSLRPLVLDDLGLADSLAALAASVMQSSGLIVRRRVDATHLDALAPDEQIVLYRVAQESLTNVVRHARATSAELSVTVAGGVLELCVADDGAGIDARAQGSGLRGMRERALLVGAALEVEPGPDGGTRIVLRLPLAPPPPPG